MAEVRLYVPSLLGYHTKSIMRRLQCEQYEVPGGGGQRVARKGGGSGGGEG
jgi:hypothetical protein